MRLKQTPCVICAIATVAALTVGCKPVNRDPSMPMREGVQVVAHRGASRDAPENTLAAFREAWRQGADAIECDVRLSRDGVIVAVHDASTRKTGGRDKPVAEQTFEELRQLDVGSWKSDDFQNERIPTLGEVLATVPRNRGVLIELKAGLEIIDPLEEVLRNTTCQPEQLSIIAFDQNVIAECTQRFPNVRTLWLVGFDHDNDRWQPTLDDVLRDAKALGVDGIDVEAEHVVVNEAFVKAVHDADLECHVWTVNDKENAEQMIRAGVDSLTTDRPWWIGNILQQMNDH